MKCKRHLVFVAAIAIASCSTPTYYPAIQLTNNIFQSPDGYLRGRVPQGWVALSESDLPPHLSAWLVNEDYSALLTFQEIKVDKTTANMVEQAGLTLLAEISFSLKKAEQPSTTLVRQPQAVTLGGKQFAQYEYRSEEQRASVVIFRVKNRYVESTAVHAQLLGKEASRTYENVLNTQQAVLLSIE